MMKKPKSRDSGNKERGERGQAVVELAFQIPLMLVILFGCTELARVFYTYHTLQKALRGGAALIARSVNVNYCNPTDAALAGARNVMVYGNLQGEGSPLVRGFVPEMIQIFPERLLSGTTTVADCPCSTEADSCDISAGGKAPDFVVVNLGSGYPLPVPFPFLNLGTINLKVSVRMPVTGG